VPWQPLYLLGPLTCGTYAREIDGLVVHKATIALRSRHSTKRMHAVQAMESFPPVA
jgi:hypothetical protein